LRKHSPWPGVLKVVASSVAVVLVSTVSLGAYLGWNFGAKISANSFGIDGESSLAPIEVGEIQGGFNMLVVGADNDPEQGDAYGARGGTLNDVNILLHVADDHKSATVVSLPRDLVIPHPSCTDPASGETYAAMSAQPLNVAMSRGGISCVVNTVESLTGLDIPYAAQLSFKAVVKMTDAIGGVTVCVADDIVDPKADLDLKAGMQTISGKTALGFLRTRHGVGDGSDLSRISVQQIYLSALVRQVKSADTLTNPGKLYNLADAAATYVKLSKSLTSLDTMVAMAKTLRTMDLSKLTFIQYPGTTGNANYPGKVVPDVAAAAQLIDAIKADKPVKASSVGMAAAPDDETDEETAEATGTASAPSETGAPEPNETPTETTTSSETATPEEPSTPSPSASEVTVAGSVGQSADQSTCAKGYLQ
jgi:LCP family protein required for cell wall assembly